MIARKVENNFTLSEIMSLSARGDKVREKILAVQQMQDYIAAHISEKITLCDLSEAARYSPFYCARIFKELTGFAPADYIRRLRLSRSALRLRDEACKVIEFGL